MKKRKGLLREEEPGPGPPQEEDHEVDHEADLGIDHADRARVQDEDLTPEGGRTLVDAIADQGHDPAPRGDGTDPDPDHVVDLAPGKGLRAGDLNPS